MKHLYTIILILLILSCESRFTPKPLGYLRIDLDEKKDSVFTLEQCPFTFNAPNYFDLEYNNKNKCWINLKYSKHRATIHLTYKQINGDLVNLLEESRNMVYKHTVKADAINEKKYLNDINNSYGTLYDIHGQTASSVQFYITDSVYHFIRGALYFEVNPNQDSLKPIINYLRKDIINIMESVHWEENNFLTIKNTDT